MTTPKLIKLNVPLVDRYYPRPDEEGKVMQGIRKLAEQRGVLLVGGFSGVGKTTLVSNFIHDPRNADFFLNQCNIHVIVSNDLNNKWKEFGHFCQFLNHHFKTRQGGRILFVLDDIVDDSIIDAFLRQCDSAICLAITQDPGQFPQRRFQHSFIVGQMPLKKLSEMLRITLKQDKFSSQDLTKFARFCCGSPLVASLLAGFAKYRAELKEITQNVNIQRQEEAVKSIFGTVFGQILDETTKQRYNVFLLFKPMEPVKIEDLSFLWHISDDDEVISIAEKLAKMSIVRRNGPILSQNLAYFVHEILFYNLAAELFDSSENMKKRVLLEICKKLANGANDDAKELQQFVYKCPKSLLASILANFGENDFQAVELADEAHQGDCWPIKHVEERLQLVARFGLTSLFQLLDHGSQSWRGGTALIDAVENGHLGVAKFIAEKHPDTVVLPNVQGETALAKAAQRGKLDVVKFLYEKCPDLITACDNNGEIPLMKAANSCHFEVVEFLWGKCPESVKSVDNYGNCSLMKTALKGHFDLVKFLYETWPESIKLQDCKGETALMKAAQQGHLAVVQFLYEKCAESIEMQDVYGNTAFFKAAACGRLDVAEFFYAKYPEIIDISNSNGETALMKAYQRNHHNVVKFILSKANNSNAAQY